MRKIEEFNIEIHSNNCSKKVIHWNQNIWSLKFMLKSKLKSPIRIFSFVTWIIWFHGIICIKKTIRSNLNQTNLYHYIQLLLLLISLIHKGASECWRNNMVIVCLEIECSLLVFNTLVPLPNTFPAPLRNRRYEIRI